MFANEAGGHRIQRVPTNDKKARVQSSTITVAVLRVPEKAEIQIEERDLEWKTCRSSGAGGQHVNKTDSAVQLTHKPSGLSVRCESERSQHQNRASALALLSARLLEQKQSSATNARNADRKAQVGSAERSDKRRTIRFQDALVNDHELGKRMELKSYLRGDWKWV